MMMSRSKKDLFLNSLNQNFGDIEITYRITILLYYYTTGCPKKHGNSVTKSISSLLWISIVIPDLKIHRVYFMKTVNGCKDVFIMSPQDEQWRRTSLFCLYTGISWFTKYNRMQSKHKQTNCKHSRGKSYGLQLSR